MRGVWSSFALAAEGNAGRGRLAADHRSGALVRTGPVP